MTTQPKLMVRTLATASTREKMEATLRKFYCTENATFTTDGQVSNGVRIIPTVRIVPHRGGFKFQTVN